MTIKPEKSQKTPSFSGLAPASESASRAKRANKKKDSRHETLLRQELWKLGLRYRKHVAKIPGNPDIVFRQVRVVVFCDGDFWHGRNWEKLRADLERRHNPTYWIAKISRNRERDGENAARLLSAGWLVLRFWESDILCDPRRVAISVKAIVDERACQGTSSADSPEIVGS